MSGRRYQRKSQVYSGNNAGSSNSYSDKVFSTLYNPFSIKNNNPKWPDGLANYSVGKKNQFSSEVYGRDLVLCLFPGMSNWFQCYLWDETENRFELLTNHERLPEKLVY